MSVGSCHRFNSVGVKKCPPSESSNTPTHGYFVLSPVSLEWWPVEDGGPSNSTIDMFNLTEKVGDCGQSRYPLLANTLYQVATSLIP